LFKPSAPTRVGFVETGHCKVAAMGLVSTADPLFNPTIAFWDPYSQIRRRVVVVVAAESFSATPRLLD